MSKFMDDYVLNHLENLYGLNPNVPHMAFQFPRLPPGMTHTAFPIHRIPVKERFGKNAYAISKRLDEFEQTYKRQAVGLFTVGPTLVPPGHPLYSDRMSETLKAENNKLLKENSDLKKELAKLRDKQ